MPKPLQYNPVQTALRAWMSHQLVDADVEQQNSLLNTAPKRFTIYEPLAILPSGSFAGVVWRETLEACSEESLKLLWKLLLQELSNVAKGPLSNLAINQGIPLLKEGETEENILRSPTGLQLLFGDFGPSTTASSVPTIDEFSQAFWATTKQNGIHQTWAPRWTMFSRGNVKEKARLLKFNKASRKQNIPDQDTWAVDLYGGIGYFVFSYASLGMRVLCWEINPWSVEGLRRGALLNRWTVKVIQGKDLDLPITELLSGQEQIIVFLEDNQKAKARIQAMWEVGIAQNIAHINCGFLPTSEPTWRHAWEITSQSSQSWLHLHENVGVSDIEIRQQEIKVMFQGWKDEAGGDNGRALTANHIEQVKTYAPGVWHCVFDIYINKI